MKKMYSEVVLITPDMAKNYLANSAGNARFAKEGKLFNAAKVTKLASYMRSGKWELNSQGISFNEDGNLVDGHHRLAAIVESGCSIEMYVTHNVPNGNELFDVGWNRSEWQVMKSISPVNPQLASKRGTAISNLHFYFVRERSKAKANLVTMHEKAEFLLREEGTLLQALRICDVKHDGKRMLLNGYGVYSCFCALKCGVKYEEVLEFAKIVTSGMCDGKEKLAAVTCRNYLLDAQTKRSTHIDLSVELCGYIQTSLADYLAKKPRQVKYKYTSPIYTDMYLKTIKGDCQ